MNHVTIDKDFVKSLIEGCRWEDADLKVELKEKLDESNVEAAEEVVVEEHTCPMCQAPLTEALDDDTILECVNRIVSVLEELNEETESEDDESDDSEDFPE